MSKPSCILIFDRSAILSNTLHLWQEVSRLGSCEVPQAALDEIASIASTAPDSRTVDGGGESPREIARKFREFFPRSGWQSTDVQRAHENLNPSAGHAQSRKARLNLAVAQCANGTAQLNPDRLVVLVTDEQTLMQSINQLGIDNLCAASSMGTRQWARTNQPPASVAQGMARLKAGSLYPATSSLPAPPPLSESNLTPPTAARTVKRGNLVGPIYRAIGRGVGAAIAVGFLLYLWRWLQPLQFNQMWHKTGLPSLPALPFEEPHAKPRNKS